MANDDQHARLTDSTKQPAPVANDHPPLWPLVAEDVGKIFDAGSLKSLVLADMQARDDFGAQKYKTRLQPYNNRDALLDAYQEALDLAVYLRQTVYEGLYAGMLYTEYTATLRTIMRLRQAILDRDTPIPGTGPEAL